MKQTNLANRLSKPTPKFFRKLRNIGLALAAAGAAFIAAPISLPIILVKAAGYVALAGGVISAVSQSAVKMEKQYYDIHHHRSHRPRRVWRHTNYPACEPSFV